MPLLHVGPCGFARDRYESQRRGSATEETGIQVCISRYINDAGCLSVDVVLLQRLRIGLIAIRVLEENAIAAADGPLPVAEWVIRETKAWSGVPPMVGHAAGRNPGCDTAVDPSVERISDYQPSCRIHAAGAGDVVGRIEIPGQMIFLGISSEKTHPQSDVQCQAWSGVPIILNEGLKDVVLLVHLECSLFLCEGADISQKHIGKRISGRDRTAGTKLQQAIHA